MHNKKPIYIAYTGMSVRLNMRVLHTLLNPFVNPETPSYTSSKWFVPQNGFPVCTGVKRTPGTDTDNSLKISVMSRSLGATQACTLQAAASISRTAQNLVLIGSPDPRDDTAKIFIHVMCRLHYNSKQQRQSNDKRQAVEVQRAYTRIDPSHYWEKTHPKSIYIYIL